MKKEGVFQYLNTNTSNKNNNNKVSNFRTFNGTFGSKQFPSFSSLHAGLKCEGVQNVAPNTVRVTPPELLKKHTLKEEEDEDTNDNAAAEAYRVQQQTQQRVTSTGSNQDTRNYNSNNNTAADPFGTPFGEQPVIVTSRSNNPSPKRMSVTITADSSVKRVSPTTSASNAAVVDLLNYEEVVSPSIAAPQAPSQSQARDAFQAHLQQSTSTTSSANDETPRYHVVDKSTGEVLQQRGSDNNLLEQLDTGRYRVVNLDTGEVLDIRDIAKLQQQEANRRKQQQQAQQSASQRPGGMKLAPPPSNSNARPNTTAAAAARRKSTDPFSLSTIKSGFTDVWDSVTTADPFGFNTPSNTSSTQNTPTRQTASTSNAGFVPTAAAPVTKGTNSGGSSPFAPSASWSAAPPPQQQSSVRPVGGVYPPPNNNNGLNNGFNNAPPPQQQQQTFSMQPPPARPSMMQQQPMNTGHHSMAPPLNPFGGGQGQGGFAPTQQGQQGGYGMQPPQGQPQYQVRQVGQSGPGAGGVRVPPKDPFSDLVNLK